MSVFKVANYECKSTPMYLDKDCSHLSRILKTQWCAVQWLKISWLVSKQLTQSLCVITVLSYKPVEFYRPLCLDGDARTARRTALSCVFSLALALFRLISFYYLIDGMS